jgi:hypothetical protein
MQRYSYKVYVTVGRIGAMRQLFEKIVKSQPYKGPAGDPTAAAAAAAKDGAGEFAAAAAADTMAEGLDIQQQELQQQEQQHSLALEVKHALLLGRIPAVAAASSSSAAAAVAEVEADDS